MHTIRVYRKSGGLYMTFRGINAEQLMRDHFGGQPDDRVYLVLR